MPEAASVRPVSLSDLEQPSGVRLRSAPGRYRVEYAMMVAEAMVLDLQHDAEFDDIEESLERAAELERRQGPGVVVIVWDQTEEREVLRGGSAPGPRAA